MSSSDDNIKRKRAISPPVLKRKKPRHEETTTKATPATVEAGRALIKDHLQFYSDHFSPAIRHQHALLTIPAWQSLYRRNLHPGGHHFVIHQHDHPVAGMHYDLRLQINETSSCSWAIMYGLPGNPNSARLNRNATETRIHCLWNHLVESASHATGSLLVWDTGEYEVLSRNAGDDDSTDAHAKRQDGRLSEPEKLVAAFKGNKIRLRLHGSRLPKGYVLYIRRPKKTKLADRPSRQQRRRKISSSKIESSDNDNAHGHSDIEEGDIIRQNNAYTGALNTIGSVHQRTWYASMDRVMSGFQKTRRDGESVWVKRDPDAGQAYGGFETFIVRGREHERSVVTGRTAGDIMQDEAVMGYVPRAGWRAIVE